MLPFFTSLLIISFSNTVILIVVFGQYHTPVVSSERLPIHCCYSQSKCPLRLAVCWVKSLILTPYGVSSKSCNLPRHLPELHPAWDHSKWIAALSRINHALPADHEIAPQMQVHLSTSQREAAAGSKDCGLYGHIRTNISLVQSCILFTYKSSIYQSLQ